MNDPRAASIRERLNGRARHVVIGERTWRDAIADFIIGPRFATGFVAGCFATVGLVPDAHKRRLTENMAKNFRSGIDAGKRKVARMAATEGMVQ